MSSRSTYSLLLLRWPRFLAVALAAVVLGVVSGCANTATGAGAGAVNATAAGTEDAAEANELRLGYFANLTHAIPVLGVANGQFQSALGDTQLSTQVFNAGPSAIEALLSGAIDATYIGPNPAINAFSKSDGEAVRIVSGATSGGAQFVVAPDVTESNLAGRTFATPQLGNTQDVALRYWLQEKGLSAPRTGGGDVNVQPTENATTLDLFKAGEIDGAWVPEPWASRLVIEGGGKVLVNEADLWPDGQFVTTHLLVATEFLAKYPATVEKLLQGHLATLEVIQSDPEASRDATNAALESLTGKALNAEILSRAWPNLTLTVDPVASSLQADQDHAEAVGLAQPTALNGIYDLRILNGLLSARGQAPVSAGGLGQQ